MTLNPFDLRGPEFLLFYIVLGTAVIIWIGRRLHRIESATPEEVELAVNEIAKDPYQIAFLRGGRAEIIRVAVVSLLERGLLQASGENLATAGMDAKEKVRRNLDKAILAKFLKAQSARNVFLDAIVLEEAVVAGEPLMEKKLLPDRNIKSDRRALCIRGVAFLLGIAGIKIYVALSRGHTNIVFLIILAILALIIIAAMTHQVRTTFGNQVFDKLKQMFTRLSERPESIAASPGSVELTYLIAVFGLATLPAGLAGMVAPLRIIPPKGSSGGGCGASSCGGSSCGGGGGCGGGGCGGGCGGCGG